MRESFAGRHILVTGVSGFLGKVWLAWLLQEVPDVGRITVLLRGKKGQGAEQRFLRILASSPVLRALRQRHRGNYAEFMHDKIRMVEGELGQPWLGLGEAAAKRLAASVDVVVHFAGMTDFEPDPRQALAINVLGSLHISDLAALSQGKRMVYVSTAYVAGNVSGEIPERIEVGRSPNGTPFSPSEEFEALQAICQQSSTRSERIGAASERARRLGWPNIYTYTKALSEHLLAARADLHLTIVRPTIVESALRFPFPGWNEGVNTSAPLVWLLSSSFCRFPSRAHHRFDVIPVDAVARATSVITALALKDRSEAVYHLATSSINPMSFGRAIDLTALASRRMHDRKSRSSLEKRILKHLDAYAVDGDRPSRLGLPFLRANARQLRDRLQALLAEKRLRSLLGDSLGSRVEDKLRRLSMACKNTERRWGQMEEMLRLYRPFIHDKDYLFQTRHIREAYAQLNAEDRRRFAFGVEGIDWRHYWLEVQIPGLERWSLPLLRGEKVEGDPPLEGFEERWLDLQQAAFARPVVPSRAVSVG